MKNKLNLITLVIISSSLLFACKKYEDGPAISLASKTSRITNDWRVEKAIDNGNEVTGSFDKYEISLRKNETASLTAHYTFLGVTYDYNTQGTWSLEDNKEMIRVDYENDQADASYYILRLKEKELWVRQEGTNLELHLAPL